ncbi:hypothetical protein INT47_010239 [Mucor saturninus]|uniref:Rho-GAP domain-containing protein n=1 Tax=Mucor saturninus TaxID=64648 RepID=A0A8H7RF29_9FUNG|nr:hypothetical protein INT47_010239 [Mucor saturninus]
MTDHFSNSFWSPSNDPIPNYSHGLHVLHDRLSKSVLENETIAHYLQARINTENQCAQLLAGNTTLDPLIIMNTSLNSAFEMVRSESSESSHCHHIRAGLLAQDVLEPLQNFTRSFQAQLNQSRASLDNAISEFQHTAQSALLTRSVYWSRCRALELVCPDYRPPVPAGFEEQEDEDDDFVGARKRSSSVTSELNVDTGGVRLGQCTVLTYREVARSMSRMQKMIESTANHQQSRKFLGKHIFEWVRDYMTSPPTSIQLNQLDLTLDSETLEICQHLVALKFLRSVPKETAGFGLDRDYEIQQNVVERYKRKTRIRHTEEVPHEQDNTEHTLLEVPSSSNNGPVGVLGNILGRMKMDSTTKAHVEMKEADTVYQNKIKAVDRMRRSLEETLVAHFNDMEALEKERIEKIKHAFITMASALSNTLPMFKETYNRITLFQETLKADQDIHYIVEQYSTGPFCPKPMIYENYYHGSATNQIFGVPLEEVAQIYGSYVPPIVHKGIQLIDAGLITDKGDESIWLDIMPVKEINLICEKLDGLVGSQLKTALEGYDMHVLANLIRVYLLELPECLLTFDLYDPVKLLYAQQDTAGRLVSLSKLLATLPSANYHTLKALSHHLFKILKQQKDEKLLNGLISTFSYILLRPRTSLPIHSHDRHPKRLVRDLLTQYPVIFTKDGNRAQKSGASRSSIVADTLILPPRQPILFDDPDTSQPSTPRASEDGQLSKELSLLMLTEDVFTDPIKKPTPNRSRASTRGTMDNVVLDSFFDD